MWGEPTAEVSYNTVISSSQWQWAMQVLTIARQAQHVFVVKKRRFSMVVDVSLWLTLVLEGIIGDNHQDMSSTSDYMSGGGIQYDMAWAFQMSLNQSMESSNNACKWMFLGNNI